MVSVIAVLPNISEIPDLLLPANVLPGKALCLPSIWLYRQPVLNRVNARESHWNLECLLAVTDLEYYLWHKWTDMAFGSS
jgi:hypothetical protein